MTLSTEALELVRTLQRHGRVERDSGVDGDDSLVGQQKGGALVDPDSAVLRKHGGEDEGGHFGTMKKGLT